MDNFKEMNMNREGAAIFVALNAADYEVGGMKIGIISGWPQYGRELMLMVAESLRKFNADFSMDRGYTHIVVSKQALPGKRKWYAPWKRHMNYLRASEIYLYNTNHIYNVMGTLHDIVWLDWPYKIDLEVRETMKMSLYPGGRLVQTNNG